MLKIKKNGNKVWVTFTFAPDNVVENVAIVGEWNQWKEESMKKKKNGDYYLTKIFTAGNSFQFGYKVNGSDWVSEEQCESVASPFSSQNSLLVL